jgi:protein TonB
METPNLKLNTSLDDLVFERRERAYGAYAIRKKQPQILERAALMTLILFLMATALPKTIMWLLPEVPMISFKEFEIPLMVDPTTIEIDVKEPELPSENTPPPSPPPNIDQTRFVEIKPSSRADLSSTIADIDKLDSTAIGLKDIQGDKGGAISFPPNPPITGNGNGGLPTTPTDTLPDFRSFIPLDKEPKPVNLDEIRKAIGYPKLALEAEIEGRVTLRVLIDKNGKYQRHLVTSVAHKLLVDAVVSKIPLLQMTPGIQGTKAIPVWVTVPFEFKLKQKGERR